MKRYDSLSQLVEKKLRGGKISKIIALIFLALGFIVCFTGIIAKNYILCIVSIVIFYGAFASWIVYVDSFKAANENFKWLKEKGLENIASDVDINDPTYKKAQICCGNNALVFRKLGVIVPYSELIWAYAYEHRINGIRVEKSFRIHTKNGKMYTLQLTPEEFVILIKLHIIQHSPDFMMGYTKPNKKLYKNIVKETKQSAKTLKK